MLRFKVWETISLVVGSCCVGFINSVGVVAGVWRQRLALSIGPNTLLSRLMRGAILPLHDTSSWLGA
jgi:hypothetical protein